MISVSHKTKIKAHTNKWRMGGGRCRDQNGFGAAVLHAILRIVIVLDRRWEISCDPFTTTGLGVTSRNELNARLLESENARTDRT